MSAYVLMRVRYRDASKQKCDSIEAARSHSGLLCHAPSPTAHIRVFGWLMVHLVRIGCLVEYLHPPIEGCHDQRGQQRRTKRVEMIPAGSKGSTGPV